MKVLVVGASGKKKGVELGASQPMLPGLVANVPVGRSGDQFTLPFFGGGGEETTPMFPTLTSMAAAEPLVRGAGGHTSPKNPRTKVSKGVISALAKNTGTVIRVGGGQWLASGEGKD